jgi:hypothetical protein
VHAKLTAPALAPAIIDPDAPSPAVRDIAVEDRVSILSVHLDCERRNPPRPSSNRIYYRKRAASLLTQYFFMNALRPGHRHPRLSRPME